MNDKEKPMDRMREMSRRMLESLGREAQDHPRPILDDIDRMLRMARAMRLEIEDFAGDHNAEKDLEAIDEAYRQGTADRIEATDRAFRDVHYKPNGTGDNLWASDQAAADQAFHQQMADDIDKKIMGDANPTPLIAAEAASLADPAKRNTEEIFTTATFTEMHTLIGDVERGMK